MKNRTYRYFTGDVLYPFGFGLSYTKWSVSDPEMKNGEISVRVRNEGTMDGDAVIQVYVSIDSPDAPVHPRLCGFRRAAVKAGNEAVVSVPLDRLAGTVVNDQGERISVPHMTFHIGMSQPDPVSVRMSGVQPVTLSV